MTNFSMKSRVFCLLAAVCSLGLSAKGDQPAIIAKARAYLGTEAALDGITSVHLVGQITAEDPKDATKSISAAIDIIFQKPMQECITTRSSATFVRTALNGTEAWHEVQSLRGAEQNAIDPSRPWNLTLLSLTQVKVLRVDTLENLWAYRGAIIAGGEIKDEGAVMQDAIACEKVALVYSPTIIYHRYFEQDTGRVVYSETEGGPRIREQGEIMAGGIRFPKTIVIVEKNAAGKDSTKTYTFDKVTLNETFPISLFAVPELPPIPMHSAPSDALPNQEPLGQSLQQPPAAN